jgi:integrase
MAKKADRFPYAKSYPDRHGKRRWRYRVKGFTAELGTEWGSEEFARRYAEAENRQKSKPGAGVAKTVPRSFNDLVARFYALHFPTIEASTRKDYRALIEPLREKHGHKTVAHMRIRHVMEIKADLAATPHQANKTLKRLSQLMDLAVKLEWRTDNPVKGVDRFKTGSGGFHSWDEGEIARFYEIHQAGSPAYLCMTLMLYTGAARADAVKLGWGNLRGGRLEYRRQKTRKNPDGILVSIPLHPRLEDALKAVPKGAFTFLETDKSQGRTANGLGTAMRKWCDKAGLPLCSSHGLRKAICRRIAEAGGEAHEIMSVSGHITLAEAQRYCESFGRKGLADSAISRLPHGAKTEQNLTNHPARFVKKSNSGMKRKEK